MFCLFTTLDGKIVVKVTKFPHFLTIFFNPIALHIKKGGSLSEPPILEENHLVLREEMSFCIRDSISHTCSIPSPAVAISREI